MTSNFEPGVCAMQGHQPVKLLGGTTCLLAIRTDASSPFGIATVEMDLCMSCGAIVVSRVTPVDPLEHLGRVAAFAAVAKKEPT